MIERSDVLSIPYLKKTTFTGSSRGMRFLLRMEKGEEQNTLTATCWAEPYSFDATKAEDKISEAFEFSEEGIQKAVDWLNEVWQQKKEVFLEAKHNWDARTESGD